MKRSPLSKLTGQGLCEMSVARYMDNHVCLSKVQFNDEMDPFQPDFCSITSNSDHFGHRFSKEWAWDHPRWLTTYDEGWTWYRDLDYHVLITALCKIHVNNLKKCWIVQFVVVLFHKLQITSWTLSVPSGCFTETLGPNSPCAKRFYQPTGSNSTHCHLHCITHVLDDRPSQMNWEVFEGVDGRLWRGAGTSEVLRNRLGPGRQVGTNQCFQVSLTCVSGILCVINIIRDTLLLARIVWLVQMKGVSRDADIYSAQ